MEKNQLKKHIVGTYPKTKGKIVETEKKNRYENQNYHTVGIHVHVVPKYIQKKTETISISLTHIILLLCTPEGTVLL